MTEYSVSHSVTWFEHFTGTPLSSELFWSDRDPVAVTVKFRQGGEDITWVFARELLSDVASGKTSRAGLGDVQVTRLHSAAGDLLLLKLAVHQTARFRTPLDEIKTFLNKTYSYAAPGEEMVDIDGGLARLLSGEWEADA